MWQVAQRRDVLHYKTLGEFVMLVTDPAPDLLDAKQRGKLLLQLRARVSHWGGTVEVFPAEYDLSYVTDMQLLVWEFLSKLERVLPEPDLGATVEMSTQVFSCSECPFFHMQESYLLQHMEHSHPEQNNKLQVTAKKTPAPQPFPIHDRPDPHTCLDCGKTFRRASDVTCHQCTHTGERPYSCEEYSKAFKNSWDLTRHRHVRTRGRPFLCSQCGKRFTQMGLFRLHFDRTTCSRTCNSPLDLTTEVVDAEENPCKEGGEYKCQKCGESFSSILKRLRHREAHLVRRQYRCSQCEKIYSRASDLSFSSCSDKTHYK